MNTERNHPRLIPLAPDMTADGGSGSGAGKAVAPLAVMALNGGQAMTLYDSYIETPSGIWPLDDSFGARLAPDPRAPLTVVPPIGLGLLTKGTYWSVFLAAKEADAIRMLAAIQRACNARGITPIGMDGRVVAPVAPRPAPQIAWPAPAPGDLRESAATETEAVLVAIVHLSLLFAPVVLSVLVWAALRASAPQVAYQARAAAQFQAIVYAFALAVLGITYVVHAADPWSPLTSIGLVCFVALLLAAAVWAFRDAIATLSGRDAR